MKDNVRLEHFWQIVHKFGYFGCYLNFSFSQINGRNCISMINLGCFLGSLNTMNVLSMLAISDKMHDMLRVVDLYKHTSLCTFARV